LESAMKSDGLGFRFRPVLESRTFDTSI